MRARSIVSLAAGLLALSSVFPAAAESFRNPDGVAVIIGNRAYEHRDVPDVEYAHRDAAAFRRYVEDVLGFDPENVIYREDATKAQLERVFGNRDTNVETELWSYLESDGGSDVVVFYSGHGIPGPNDKRGYLLPSNADPGRARIDGYPIDLLLSNLEGLEDAHSVQVYMDACFSGSSHSGLLVRGISGPVIVELREVEPESKMTVLTAASGDQLASWDEKAGHGLFTHHLLDALYGLGDEDGDGSVTALEAKSWLDDHMTRAARRDLLRVQKASLVGDGSAVLASAASSEGGFPARPVLPPDPVDVPFDVAPLDDVLVALSDVSARSGPGIAYEAAGTIARDAEVTVTGSVTVSGVGWLRVSLPGGGLAFVPASALGERGPDPAALAPDLSLPDRVLVQRGLLHLGFDPGPVDGFIGPSTVSALTAWQSAKGLDATGRLTRDQADALMAAGEAARDAARREDEAYALALAAGTEASWASYLSSYPAGRHAVEARRERDRLRAEAAAAARREAEARRAAEAARVAHERDDAAYRRARSLGTAAAYDSYLGSHPAGRHAAEARRARDRLRDDEAFAAALDLSWSDRVLVQRGLAHAGFDPGPADGVFGRRTRGAIESYQRDKGLRATGYPTAGLGEALIALGGVARREDEAYAHARSAGTEASWASYLSSYPAGRHADEARRERDRLRAEVAAAARRAASARRALDDQAIPPPGSVFRDCADCPEMVVVRAGEFMMGSPSSEEGRRDTEGPRHRVTNSEPFAVGVYEVTFSEWDACVSDGGCGGYRPGDEGWGRGSRPVINVSWDDAQAYVRWLSGETDKSYRLLSESEWEYVARAGTTTPFHTGATISTDQANYNGRSTYGSGREGVYRERTMPVGSFAANAWGLHDVHGNVQERTEDCWNDSYAGAPDDGGAWTRGNCSGRVVRGGSWVYGPVRARSADRRWDGTGSRYYLAGFRLARTFAP